MGAGEGSRAWLPLCFGAAPQQRLGWGPGPAGGCHLVLPAAALAAASSRACGARPHAARAHPPACHAPAPPAPPAAVFMHDNFARGAGSADESAMVVVTKTHVYAVEGDESEED